MAELRFLTSIELYFHSKFYGKRCCFEPSELSERDVKKKPSNYFFNLSLKRATIDLRFKTFRDAVKHEVF